MPEETPPPFVAADILTERVDWAGNVVATPEFRRPTDDEWDADPDAAIQQDLATENAEIAWMEENGIRVHSYCSVDRTQVTTHVVGTSETATCPNGHRWVRTFGQHDGYRQVR